MTVERRNFPQFFITAPSPCPYLPERQERKVFTHLVGGNAQDLNSQLSSGGFRRSQNIAYRPACEACHACVSVRVPVEMFEWKRSYRRILDANADVTRRTTKAQASSEHYSLFRDYVDTRHSEGGMADMTVLDFAAMIDQTVVQSKLIEYRVGGGYLRQGKLIAAVLADTLHDGVSLIYSFYAPDMPRRSLGTFMILDAIRYAAEHKLPHVYLGYWVEGSRKMHYKSRFLPQERLTPDGWRLYRRES